MVKRFYQFESERSALQLYIMLMPAFCLYYDRQYNAIIINEVGILYMYINIVYMLQ